jgi:hypothetical protein
MLMPAARYLPKGVKAILLAARWVMHTEAMSTLRRLGWHYRIMPSATLRERRKGNTWLWCSKGG